MKKERIGIFGGTFDPPHLGHLILACEVYAQLNLDRLLWMLTPDPPHKKLRKISALKHRKEMVRLAIADNDNFELSLVEAERLGPHYSVDTVQIVCKRNVNAEIVYLMGGDSLRNLHSWHRPVDFIAACDEIGVMRRPDAEIDSLSLTNTLSGLKSKLHIVNAPKLEISSRDIRHRIRAGLPVRYYLLREVNEYVLGEKLYIGT